MPGSTSIDQFWAEFERVRSAGNKNPATAEEARRLELVVVTDLAVKYDAGSVYPALVDDISSAACRLTYSKMERLERKLKRLRADEDQFFNGAARLLFGTI